MRLAPFIIFFFIAGGIRECPFYEPWGLKWWAASAAWENQKVKSEDGSAQDGPAGFPVCER